jgi:hypothetical protein
MLDVDQPKMDTAIGQLFDITATLEEKTRHAITKKHPCPKIAAIETIIDEAYAKISAARKLKKANTMAMIHRCDRIELETLLEIEKLHHGRNELIEEHLQNNCMVCVDVVAGFDIIERENGEDRNGIEDTSAMKAAKGVGKYVKSTAVAVGSSTIEFGGWGAKYSGRKLSVALGTETNPLNEALDVEGILVGSEDEDDHRVISGQDDWEML